MKTKYGKSFLALISLLLITSCIQQKKLEYLQYPITEPTNFDMQETDFIRIKPNDELYIKVSSFDDVNFNFFSSENDYLRATTGNELSLSIISYTVNDAGEIYFPVLGNIKVNGLTLDELSDKLEDLLKEYFNQPTAVVKFAYKKITVLGEVNMPGNYTYSKDQLNVFEAISLAGDLTFHGNRKEIYLLRNQNDTTVQKSLIDLTNDKLVFSQNYYLQPDDIIYIAPRTSVKWGVVSTPISLFLSSVTTFFLILRYFNTD